VFIDASISAHHAPKCGHISEKADAGEVAAQERACESPVCAASAFDDGCVAERFQSTPHGSAGQAGVHLLA
jgi:hypothetical protein